jgi:hypothetical protein
MSQDASLRDFILGYCQQEGGIIEPPAYGIDEVLLPDEVAARWRVNSFLRLTFDPNFRPPSTPEGSTEIILLHYGHPLVETIVSELRIRPADACFFINPPRMEKPGLREIVEKLVFANARPNSGNTTRIRQYHYVCFNFKASLVSDEKKELIVPVWMHLQGGYRVSSGEIISKVILDRQNDNPLLETAPCGWGGLFPNGNPLSPEMITALLDRTQVFVTDEIAPILSVSQERSQHFLDLDLARLSAYYADLQNDLEKRLARADEERRPGLEAKLTALAVERQSKLADAEQKYHLRLDLELINLAIIAQPKIEIDIEINKRGVSAKRTVAWDPVRHILEPLVCEVCGRPGERLTLCESGHLTHSDCLAPQCVDCKRTFCRLCAEKIHTCQVCDSPVCIHSLVSCKSCGRETCQKHINLCHAVDGLPLKPVIEPAAPALPASKPQSPGLENSQGKGEKRPAPKSKTRAKIPPIKKPAHPSEKEKLVTAQQIVVEIEQNTPVVRAFALKKDNEIAVRVWELTNHGISAHCRCEKGLNCKADRMIHRPMSLTNIEGQLVRMIREFTLEYHFNEKKIEYLRIIRGEPYENQLFSLPSIWKDAVKLAAAQESFDNYYHR